MTLPLLLGALAIGVLASACRSEEELPSPAPSQPSSEPPNPCQGNRHRLRFGSETIDLCHDDISKDGLFQPNEKLEILQGTARTSYTDVSNWKRLEEKWAFPQLKGLPLTLWTQNRDWIFSPKAAWDRESEKLLSQAMDFCRERGLDLKQVQELAARIQAPPGRSELKPKEKIYALMTAAVLLDLKRPDQPFYGERREFLDTVLANIKAGRLRILEDSQDLSDLLKRAVYDTRTNTMAVSGKGLDLQETPDRAMLVHELFHFYQDSQTKPLGSVEREVQAHQAEAQYILLEEGLLEKSVTPEHLEEYLKRKIITPKSDYQSPTPSAMRALFFKSRGEQGKAEKWMETCREDAEIIRAMDGILVVISGPSGPGKEGSSPTQFLRQHGPNLEKDPKILDREIAKLRREKEVEIAKMKVSLAKKEKNEAMLAQYFRTLQKTVDLFLLEIFKQGRLNPKADPSKEITLPKVARDLARLKVNHALVFSMDGVGN